MWVVEEYTLDRGYQEYPSTLFTRECSTARNKFQNVKSKLGYYLYSQECYDFQRLEGYERTRWEFEFDRKYKEYIEAMENWLGLSPEFYDYSLSEDVEEEDNSSEDIDNKTFKFKPILPALLMVTGLIILLVQFLPNDAPKIPQQPTTTNTKQQ
ncbi:MAG: hypothetical protein AAGG00_21305 [Cyanobacteria bacterium P01_H01_bin.150]